MIRVCLPLSFPPCQLSFPVCLEDLPAPRRFSPADLASDASARRYTAEWQRVREAHGRLERADRGWSGGWGGEERGSRSVAGMLEEDQRRDVKAYLSRSLAVPLPAVMVRHMVWDELGCDESRQCMTRNGLGLRTQLAAAW